MQATLEQAAGGLWGLLVGDALGVPYEFHEPGALPPPERIEMEPPAGFPRSYRDVPPGTWSDDGAQALCLAASLVECGQWEAEDFAARLLRWSSEGYMAVDGRVFDIGIQTGAALRNLAAGAPALAAGLAGERNNGNGSLMRCLSAALFGPQDAARLVLVAHEQSRVTHAHPRAEACCALYVLWARAEMAGEADAWSAAVETLRGLYSGHPAHLRELEEVILPAGTQPPRGSGYVVDCLHAARAACQEKDYAAIVRRAVSFGHDTDTTACVAGGIAGIRHGKAGIPLRWLQALRGASVVDALLRGI